MRRLIQREIEDSLSMMIISGKLGEGDTVRVEAKDEKLVLRIKKRPVIAIGTDLASPEQGEDYGEIADNEREEPCTKLS